MPKIVTVANGNISISENYPFNFSKTGVFGTSFAGHLRIRLGSNVNL